MYASICLLFSDDFSSQVVPLQKYWNSSCDHEVDSFERFTLFNERKFLTSVGVCLPQIFCVFCLRVPSLDFDLYPCQPKVPLVEFPQFLIGKVGMLSECFRLRVC